MIGFLERSSFPPISYDSLHNGQRASGRWQATLQVFVSAQACPAVEPLGSFVGPESVALRARVRVWQVLSPQLNPPPFLIQQTVMRMSFDERAPVAGLTASSSRIPQVILFAPSIAALVTPVAARPNTCHTPPTCPT